MTPDDAAPEQPEEDLAVIEPGLADPEDVATQPTAGPVAVGPGEAPPAPEADGAAVPRAHDNGEAASGTLAVGWSGMATAVDASLLDLVDRLTVVLERSDLAELEVASGGTTIILRSPAAVAPGLGTPLSPAAALTPVADGAALDGAGAGSAPAAAVAPTTAPERPAVRAPLTGIYYGAPSPGATPYVAVGNHVAVGQIIGLIEAMKLFNEIKSDLSGRVVRICADSGALVKARQPLIEVEPA
jgi:acetyl-CoA carboxylase biotin carboxyl carrier protein